VSDQKWWFDANLMQKDTGGLTDNDLTSLGAPNWSNFYGLFCHIWYFGFTALWALFELD